MTQTETKVTKDYYKIGGKKYDRVTSVLGYFSQPELVSWQVRAGKEGKQKAKTAKSIGTRVHTLIRDHWEKGNFYVVAHDTEAVKNCMEGYVEWVKIEKPVILNMDMAVFSDKLMIAGTMDIVMKGMVVLDVKTSESIRPDYWIQVAMYNYMYPDYGQTGDIGILRLDKLTADYEYKVIPYNQGLASIFMGLLNAYRYYKSFKPDKPDEAVEDREVYAPIPKENWTEFHSQI